MGNLTEIDYCIHNPDLFSLFSHPFAESAIGMDMLIMKKLLRTVTDKER